MITKACKKRVYVSFTLTKVCLLGGSIDRCLTDLLFCFKRSSISLVSRALDCKAGGCGFYSRGRINTEGLKITEK